MKILYPSSLIRVCNAIKQRCLIFKIKGNVLRLVNQIFKILIAQTIKVYVYGMTTTLKKPKEHVKNLKEIFEILRKYKMKHNSKKCAFGVSLRKFLDLKIKSPYTLKEIQSLTGKLVGLNRFISHATEKCHIFFQVMKK